MLSNHLNRIVLLMGMFRCDVQTMLRCRFDAFSLSQLAKRKEKHRHILSYYVVEIFDVFDLKKFIVCPSQPITLCYRADLPCEWVFNRTLLYTIFNALFFDHIINVLHLICFVFSISIH